MMAPEPGSCPAPAQAKEWGAALVLLPAAATFSFYILPISLQEQPLVQFSPLALIASSLIFAFDPFMVNTFQHLHWIAVWDGLIWGAMWLRTKNLYITIVAHAIEVLVMYSVVRTAIG